jgi:Uma2 family endonuclease
MSTIETAAVQPQTIADMEWVDPTSLPPTDLPSDDGEPMESPWHAGSGPLIKASYVHARGGLMTDYYVGVNMFVYYSWKQVRNKEFKGPDVYVAHNAEGQRQRLYWAIWDEDGRYPDVIIELLSDSTEREDLSSKKQLYEQTFKTSEYFCIAPQVERLMGWRLTNGRYEPIEPDERGRLWSAQLGYAIGAWRGVWLGEIHTWPRLFSKDGSVLPTPGEAEAQRAEAERQRAEAERQRADANAQRIAVLEAELRKLQRKRGKS